MKIEGEERVALERERVWRRLNDPEVLRRCTPGLESLTESRKDHFEAVLELKLPAVRGRFAGSLEYLERVPPERLRLGLEGKGAPGFVHGFATLRLEAEGVETRILYAADVQIGGPIARLGQRMLSGVVKEMAGQFFERFGAGEAAPGAPGRAPSALRALAQLIRRVLLRLLGRSRAR